MVAGEAPCVIGRWLVSFFPLFKATGEIYLGWQEEKAALPAFILYLELFPLPLYFRFAREN
jgi:hypothetical protein